MKKICFYHRVDLDGHCSGAIFRYVSELKGWDNIELIPYNYGDPIDIDKLKNCEVYFLDCTPSPIETMAEKIKSVSSKLIVCDHHRTALQNESFRKYLSEGNSRENFSGCYLTWEYFSDILTSMPDIINHLSNYDCWKNENKEEWEQLILPIQQGIKYFGSDPLKDENMKFWKMLFFSDMNTISSVINTGTILLKFEKQRLKSLAKSNSFDAIVFGHKAIVMNGCTRNSQAFDAVWDESEYDLMVVWLTSFDKNLGKLIHTFSLYSTKKDINCGELAKDLGGGGHPGAAGFRCLNFNLDSNNELKFISI